MNEEDYIELKSLKSEYFNRAAPVHEWAFVQIAGTAEFGSRVYWAAAENCSGFEAFYVEDVSVGNKEHLVTVAIHLVALWDGVRHMYVNPGVQDTGYLYYPDLNSLIKALSFIQNLESQYCEQDG